MGRARLHVSDGGRGPFPCGRRELQYPQCEVGDASSQGTQFGDGFLTDAIAASVDLEGRPLQPIDAPPVEGAVGNRRLSRVWGVWTRSGEGNRRRYLNISYLGAEFAARPGKGLTTGSH